MCNTIQLHNIISTTEITVGTALDQMAVSICCTPFCRDARTGSTPESTAAASSFSPSIYHRSSGVTRPIQLTGNCYIKCSPHNNYTTVLNRSYIQLCEHSHTGWLSDRHVIVVIWRYPNSTHQQQPNHRLHISPNCHWGLATPHPQKTN